MNKLDLIRMGTQNLWRRKLRTFLTILGVIIGTSSIVVMLSLGLGISKSMEDQVSSWGSLTTINVHKQDDGINNSKGLNKKSKLNKNSLSKIKSIPGVLAVNPNLEINAKIKTGRYELTSGITGIDPNIMEDFGFEVVEGRSFNNSDTLSIIFGGGMKDSFSDPKSQTYREPRINLMRDRMTLILGEDSPDDKNNKKIIEHQLKTIGILSDENFETSYGVFMPIEQVEKLIYESQKLNNSNSNSSIGEYNKLDVKVDNIDNVKSIQEEIKNMGFEAFSLTNELEGFKKQSRVIQAILGGIGAISLLVAAIGITNTMVMSIYERTKEIGVMKVIGASIKDIKSLFLFEAGLIGLIGGLLGLLFSYSLSFLMNTIGKSFIEGVGGSSESRISIIPIPLALGALAFSIAIGLLAGYFPAKRAMNLSALDAIKTE